MKIRVITATAVLALFAATSASADDNLTIDNDSKNAVAIGGTGSYGYAGPAHGTVYGGNARALAGSVLVSGCDCNGLDDVTLDNTSENALAVGKAVSGSIVMR